MTIEEIKNNRELRPYFLDLVSKYIVIKGTIFFTVDKSDMEQMHNDLKNSSLKLTQRLSSYVEPDQVDRVIDEVGSYYINFVKISCFSNS